MNDNLKDGQSGLGEIFKGLGRLFNVIVDMAEKNINEKKTAGELFNTNNNGGLHGKYAFSMKLGLGEKDLEHMIQNPQVIEPQTDIFREDGHITVIVEMPGVKDEDFKYDVRPNSLYITGKDNMRTYIKNIDIPDLGIKSEKITVIENNGIYKMIIKYKKSE